MILNIAANLPPNHYLYVKDHPHAGAYRDYIDYLRISEVPNIKIINPKLVEKILLISHRVFSRLMVQQVLGYFNEKAYLTFGNTFYNSLSMLIKLKTSKT